MLSPLVFSIYICELFFLTEEGTVTSYADDTIPFSNETNVLTVLNDIENKTSNVCD